MNKLLPLFIGLVLFLGVGGVVYYQMPKDTESTSAPQAGTTNPTSATAAANDDDDGDDDDVVTTGTTGTGTPASGTGSPASGTAGQYTAAQVTTHSGASSCWSIIDGNVYDLTAWISQHPGGAGAITGLCGKDGTTAFHNQHGDAKKQADILAGFKIGILVK